MIEKFIHHDQLIAIIVRKDFKSEGISFFTPDDFSQQLAYMSHSKGKEILPHVHNHITREVHYTLEVLVIRKGQLRVDFYDDNYFYLQSRNLFAGDVIILCSGGHGFEVIEDIEMIEVKQGPYLGEDDKTRFNAVENSKIKYNE